MKFSLMFFSSSEDSLGNPKYHLVSQCARYADDHAFHAIWVPERHFTKFGGLYPNPAVLHAYLAGITKQVRLHAGSVVVPIHHPIRIAEEWAMVDNLSNGRVGVSFASGWNPNDFAFFPERYESRNQDMLEGIRQVVDLWQGATTSIHNGKGQAVDVSIFPTPLQPQLPHWLTAANNPETYYKAGELGANLLTHILDQGVEKLADKIAIYRNARRKHGFDPNKGQVTVMLHTYVGENGDVVREQARKPFCAFIKSNATLLKGLANSRGHDLDLDSLSEQDLDEFVGFLYDRFATSRGLIGTPEDSLPLLQRLAEIGVDEAACLLDFGPPKDLIIANLDHLNQLKVLFESQEQPPRPDLPVYNKPAQHEPAGDLPFNPETVQARCANSLSGDSFAQMMASHGIAIEAAFRGLEKVWQGQDEALGFVRFPAELSTDGSNEFTLHPAFMDACSQVLAATLPSSGDHSLFLPFQVKDFKFHQPLGDAIWSHALLTNKTPFFEGDLRLYNEAGLLLAEILGLRIREVKNLGASEQPPLPKSQLLYNWHWQQDSTEITGSDPGHWLLFADDQGFAKHLASRLQAMGHGVSLALPSSHQGSGDDFDYLDPCSRSQIQQFVDRSRLQAQAPLRGILHLYSLSQSLESTAWQSLLDVLKIMANTDLENGSARLWAVTRAARAVLPGDRLEGIHQSPIWGLGTAAALEHPTFWGGILDLPATGSRAEDADQILSAICGQGGENRLAFRNGQRYVARLQPVAETLPDETTWVSSKSTYLITGGLGGLGLSLANWLHAHGAQHLVTLNRSAPNDAQKHAIQQLQEKGAAVHTFEADISNSNELKAVIEEVTSKLPPIKGVFHLAGVLDDGLLVDREYADFATVAAAKVEGSWHLHQHTSSLDLDAFVLFSSAATHCALPGQGFYAAANTYLDNLAYYRQAQGLPATCINWGPFADVGHAASDYGARAHRGLATMGIDPLAPERAMNIMGQLVASQRGVTVVLDVDWQKFRASQGSESPFFEAINRSVRTSRVPQLLIDLTAITPGERRSVLLDHLTTQVCRVMKRAPERAPGLNQPLFELGLDSIMALEFKNLLEMNLGQSFSATLLFENPTLSALAKHLEQALPLDFPQEKEVLPGAEPEEAELNESDLDNLSEGEMYRLIAQEVGPQSGTSET